MINPKCFVFLYCHFGYDKVDPIRQNLEKSLLKLIATLVKGYLHYKMINYQNVSSDVQVNNFFIS